MQMAEESWRRQAGKEAKQGIGRLQEDEPMLPPETREIISQAMLQADSEHGADRRRIMTWWDDKVD